MTDQSVTGPWLLGYAARGHKSLAGDELVRVGPLGKINFLVGRNNHGKSTVLHAAAAWAGKDELGSKSVKLDSAATLGPIPRRDVKRAFSAWSDRIDQVKEAGLLVDVDEERYGVWIDGLAQEVNAQAAATALKNGAGLNGIPVHQIKSPALRGHERHIVIPAFRELRPFTPASENDKRQPTLAAGEGLVAELGRWYAPTGPGTLRYELAEKNWAKLQEFMADVLEDPDVRLEVANNQQDLHVRLAQAGKMLHINDLGDGIKQVLMIAAASILYDGRLVLLEEPEIHLHAGLQRKLMRFLAQKTGSQYIIATHSAHVLDLEGAHIFHVTHDGASTRVAPAVRASEVRRVCQDLGYMASDLLQANYTIWVEGPSDRVYWKKWLEVIAPDLVEGVHFAVMTYGGYLIDGVHILDETEETVEDLVHLLQLGRECTVIADSDKPSEDAELRQTLLRLKDEADKPGSGHLITCEWVRTVENLLPRDLFRDAVVECHPKAGTVLKGSSEHGPFDEPFHGMNPSTYSKVKIAQKVAPSIGPAAIDDALRGEVEALAARIRLANGFDPAGTGAVPAACETCGAQLGPDASHQAPSDSAS